MAIYVEILTANHLTMMVAAADGYPLAHQNTPNCIIIAIATTKRKIKAAHPNPDLLCTLPTMHNDATSGTHCTAKIIIQWSTID